MREQPTSWFAGTYDDLCKEDEEYYRRARTLKALRKSFSGIKTWNFEGKPICRIYLGKDLIWDMG